MSKISAHQSHMQYATNLNMPVATPLFLNLVATNNVRLTVSGSSPQFVVDITPPEVTSVPQLSHNLSLRPNIQFDRSVISLGWDFFDAESPIWTHAVSLHTHHDGHIPLDRVLVGDVNKMTLSLSPKEQLKNGNTYVAVVTACNAAGLCTQAESAETLIDSSPPHLGGFTEPMTWKNNGGSSKVTLSWEGFDDAHSGVAFYHIMISTTYNGDDLSDGILKVAHNSNSSIQQHTFTLDAVIPTYTMVYLSIWAENGAGLLSDAAKVGVFTLLSGPDEGRLDIEQHSCDVHYCNRDCTCAVVNKGCKAGDVVHECHEVDTGDMIRVHDGIPGIITTITASSTCLHGFWENTDPSHPINRYEWTVGGKGAEPGSPIFDVINDKFWFDVELYHQSIYCVPGNNSLQHGLQFVYYVRAWHGFDNYTLVNSSGVLVDTTPPRIGMGRAVRIMDGDFEQEIEFTTMLSEVHADWERVFSDAETGINHFEVSLGTTAGGNELRGPADVGMVTRMSLIDVSLVPGFHYYITVHAYNPLGMVTSVASKRLVTDIDPPLAGVVYTSVTFKDAAHHVEDISASWHGFEDLHSFIKFYEWALGKEGQAISDIEFTSVMLETSVVIDAFEAGLEDGIRYYIYVRATDAAGHRSPIVSSNAVTLDHSAPEGRMCQKYSAVPGDWLLTCSNCTSPDCSPEYKICQPASSVHLERAMFYTVLLHTTQDPSPMRASLQVGHWWNWIQFVRQRPNLFSHYSSILAEVEGLVSPTVYLFKGDVQEVHMEVMKCDQSEATDKPLYIQQSGPVGVSLHWGVTDTHSGIKSFQVGLGTSIGGFQLQALTDVGQSSSVTLPLLLQHDMKVHAVLLVENNAGLRSAFYAEPLTIDWTPPSVESIAIIIDHIEGDVYRLSAAWKVIDKESDVQDCHWAMGKF